MTNRSPTRLTLTLGIALALVAALGVPAQAHTGTPAAAFQSDVVFAERAAGDRAKVCDANMTGDTGVAITSQDFVEPEFDLYDTAAAVTIRLTKKCKLGTLVIPGSYYSSPGPADAQLISFFKAKADGTPGKLLSSITAHGQDVNGTFTIDEADGLGPDGERVAFKWPKLKVGTKIIFSVSARMSFSEGGQWGWESSTDLVDGVARALWQNPLDGHRTGCITWSDLQTCFDGSVPGAGLMYELRRQ